MTMEVSHLYSPCHNAPLKVLTAYEGGWMGRDVPYEIICTHFECFNYWSAEGESNEYNQMPKEQEDDDQTQ